MRELRSAYQESFPLFVSSLSTQIYVNVNKLVIGAFLGMSEVSIYDMADKVLHLMKLPISMMAQAVFPKISRERNIRFVNQVMFLVAKTVLLAYICMFFGSDWIVYLFTGEYREEASTVMRLLGVSAIFVSFNGFLKIFSDALTGRGFTTGTSANKNLEVCCSGRQSATFFGNLFITFFAQ